MIRKSIAGLDIEIDSYCGLLADYAKDKNAIGIIKGLRAVSDFEFEFQMALANRKLNPEVDTLFLMTSEKYMYLSSRIVKDIASFNGDISEFIPPEILDQVKAKLYRREL